MLKANPAKIFLTIAILFFVAKPFVGFSLFSRMHQPPQDNILVKVFNKRKLEFDEKSNLSTAAYKNHSNPPEGVLLFSSCLALLIPFILPQYPALTYAHLRRRQMAINAILPAYLLNGNLTI